MAEQTKPEDEPTRRARVATWVGENAKTLVAALATTGGFLGFVAVTGGAIVWARFYAAQVPAEQAVHALPRGELIAYGAVSLTLFGILGALATVGVFLLDRGGRPTRAMSYGLVALLVVEGVIVGSLAAENWQQRVIFSEIALLAGLLSLLITRPTQLTYYDFGEALSGEEGQCEPPPEDPYWQRAHAMTYAVLAVFGPAGIGALIVGRAVDWWWGAMVGLALCLLVPCAVVAVKWLKEDPNREERLKRRDTGSKPAPPAYFRFNRMGRCLQGLIIVPFVLLPGLATREWWPSVALLVAVMLGITAWTIAHRGGPRFLWYGVAVFFSVPLFGAALMIAQQFDDPQVQPVALIREKDGVQEVLQGLYITETDKREYIASVAVEGCGDRVAQGSGRITWIPRDEVVAMSIGPLQTVNGVSNRVSGMVRDLIAARPPTKTAASASRDADARASAAAAEPRVLKMNGIRREANQHLEPDTAAPRAAVDIVGGHYGGYRPSQNDARRTVVLVNDEPASIVMWGDDRIRFAVPPDARPGTTLDVVVGCPEPVVPAMHLDVAGGR